MVEVPVDYAGERHSGSEGVHLAFESLRLKAVAAGSDKDVFCVGAVSGDATVKSNLL